MEMATTPEPICRLNQLLPLPGGAQRPNSVCPLLPRSRHHCCSKLKAECFTFGFCWPSVHNSEPINVVATHSIRQAGELLAIGNADAAHTGVAVVDPEG